MIRPSKRICTLIASAVLLSALFAVGQVVTGTILGRVTDSTGAVVPGATIQIQNVDTGFSRTEQSDSGGRYLVRNLPLGAYTVSVQQAGFRTEVRQGIILTVASEVTVNAEMAVGNVQEKVEVTASAPAVETTNATVSGLVSSEQIRDLPLNGRNIDRLALLSPGAIQQTTALRNSPIQGMGMALSVNGARADNNLFLLDGTFVNDHAQNGPNSAAGGNLGVEGILEFRVLTHSFSAEYGRSAGAVLSMVTRSGTNEFHGSAYEFVRNNIFDARNFFNPGALPAYRRNQFGAAAGGRIIKDRLFFFANYEGLRQREGLSSISTVPDANARRGLIPDPATGQLRQVTIVPSALPYVNLYPLPNGRNFGDGSAELNADVSTSSTDDYAMERMDFRLSDRDSLYWRYVYDPAERLAPFPVPIFANSVRTTSHFVATSETHIFSGSSLNEFRFGFNRTDPHNSNQGIGIDPSLDFQIGQGVGQIKFGATTGTSGAGLTSYGSNSRTQSYTQNVFQATDTYNTVRGAHSLKLGIDFQRIQLNNDYGKASGAYTFGGLLNLLAGTPSNFQGDLADASSFIRRGWRRILLGWFAQDDFRILPRLTLNIGLRHEFLTNPTEINGRSGNLIQVTDPALTPGPPFESSKKNFSPRVGVAWDPTGSGKTSVRLGAGLFYNQIDGRQWWRTATTNPTYQRGVSLTNPLFPHPFSQGFVLGSLATGSFQLPLDTPTVVHYNLEVQRQISSTLSVRAAYVGSHGYNMTRLSMNNLRVPTILADGTKSFSSTAPRVNPNFSDIERVVSDAQYNYNALQLVLQKSYSAGLQFGVAYSYSKSLSNADATTPTAYASTTSGAQDPANLDADYSLSAFDQRHTLVLNGSYQMPWEKLLNGKLAKTTLGGWAVNGIYAYGSGTPVNISIGFQNSRNLDANINDRPNLVTGASNNPIEGVTSGCQGIPAGQKLHTPDRWYDPCAFALPEAGFYGNLGRNTVTAPGTSRIDFTILKTTLLTEHKRVEFRAEFFNLLNHADFGIPLVSVFTSSRSQTGNSGRITNTATSNRQIQLGMKLIF